MQPDTANAQGLIVQNTVCYEQPLNERIRTLLRLEFLFRQVAHAAAGQSSWDTRTALQGLFEILNLTGRNELKSEILKELERHSNSLNRLRQTPGVDAETLGAILEVIAKLIDRVHGVDILALEQVRQNDFLSAIRQRSSIPGGTCRFDLPALHHWLQGSSEFRNQHLEDWLQPFQPLQEAVDLILRLIRNSATPREQTALQGFFQKSLDSTAPTQLIRVFLPLESGVFPEISGGRHRFSIRFMEQSDPKTRATQANEDVVFRLVCCVI